MIECHRKVTGAHQERASHDRVALPDPPIRNEAAEQRREVDETGVQAIDLRCRRLRRQWTHDRFDGGAKTREAGDVLYVSRQNQLVDHIQHDQRGHAVKGKSLPGLGKCEEEKPFGMTKQGLLLCVRQTILVIYCRVARTSIACANKKRLLSGGSGFRR